MAIDLPPELCSQIALHVDLHDLPAFSLACKRSAAAGVPVLYRHVLLTHRTPRLLAERLFALLATSKGLGSYVKSLAIDWEDDLLYECQHSAGPLLTNIKIALSGMTNLEFLLLSRHVDGAALKGFHLPSIRRLQSATPLPALFLAQHADRLLELRYLLDEPLPDLTLAVGRRTFAMLRHLGTTVDIAEVLLEGDLCGPQLLTMILHAKQRNIAFPCCPFYTLLAQKCPLLHTLSLVDWAPPSHNDWTLPRATPHLGIRTVALYLTYCYCVADLTCPHGEFVWEGFVESMASVLPNVEVLEFPCAPEFAGDDDREHSPAHMMTLTRWRAPEVYAKHLRRLSVARLGNGLVYSRDSDGAFTLASAEEALEPPFVRIPKSLHPWIRE